MRRRYVRMTVQTGSGKPVEVMERAGGIGLLSYIAAGLGIVLAAILLVGVW